jgi:hypothetical protein
MTLIGPELAGEHGHAQQAVKERFGHELEVEIGMIGEF